MSFKKKLVIAFSIVIILPVILFLVAFFVVGNILFHQTGDGTIQSYSAVWTDQQTATQEMDSLYNEISDRLVSDPTALEDTAYLDSLKQELNDRTFLIVRKGNAVYYTTNQRQTDKIFDKLPGSAEVTADSGEGYYIGHLDCIVKQLDFTFSDSSEGSLFIVATFMTLIPRVFLIGMLIALILVMVITGILLTNWIRRSVLHPVDELNKAMKQIRDGNLEYMLPVNQKGEIGELYQNYEDMRLRLKESDRTAAMADVLARFGVETCSDANTFTVQGTGRPFRGGAFTSFGDHRIAMSIAVGATRAAEAVEIDDTACAAKSYLTFFADFENLSFCCGTAESRSPARADGTE